MKYSTITIINLFVLFFLSANAQLKYKDSSLPVEERVKDLLSKMTLQEKVAQMNCVWQTKNNLLLNDAGEFDLAKAKQNFKQGLGQVGRPSDVKGGLDPYTTALLTNAIQKIL